MPGQTKPRAFLRRVSGRGTAGACPGTGRPSARRIWPPIYGLGIPRLGASASSARSRTSTAAAVGRKRSTETGIVQKGVARREPAVQVLCVEPGERRRSHKSGQGLAGGERLDLVDRALLEKEEVPEGSHGIAGDSGFSRPGRAPELGLFRPPAQDQPIVAQQLPTGPQSQESRDGALARTRHAEESDGFAVPDDTCGMQDQAVRAEQVHDEDLVERIVEGAAKEARGSSGLEHLPRAGDADSFGAGTKCQGEDGFARVRGCHDEDSFLPVGEDRPGGVAPEDGASSNRYVTRRPEANLMHFRCGLDASTAEGRTDRQSRSAGEARHCRRRGETRIHRGSSCTPSRGTSPEGRTLARSPSGCSSRPSRVERNYLGPGSIGSCSRRRGPLPP